MRFNSLTFVSAFGLVATASCARSSRPLPAPQSAADAPLAAEARVQLDSAIRIARTQSMWRDTVNWIKVDADVRAVARGAQSASDVYPAISLLLRRLGDHHSFVIPPTGTRAFETGGSQNPRPTVRLESDSIGYISVFGYSGADAAAAREYVATAQDSLALMMRRGATCRWVVDLRANTGGNMWPMLGGLRPLLGDGDLGTFVGPGYTSAPWHASAYDVKPSAALATLESAYVAVLTGPRTGSSGEAVTIAFRGRPRTRSFGTPTAGLTSANSSFRLPDGGMIFLAVSVEADRTGHRYGEKVDPDEVVTDTAGDATLARAKTWLGAQSACRPPSTP